MRSMRVLMVRTARRFNTDNGIRRATIVLKRYPKANAYGVFQYRQRYQEGYNYDGDHVQIDLDPFQYRQRYQEGYNLTFGLLDRLTKVSIPTTVSGGLQCR